MVIPESEAQLVEQVPENDPLACFQRDVNEPYYHLRTLAEAFAAKWIRIESRRNIFQLIRENPVTNLLLSELTNFDLTQKRTLSAVVIDSIRNLCQTGNEREIISTLVLLSVLKNYSLVDSFYQEDYFDPFIKPITYPLGIPDTVIENACIAITAISRWDGEYLDGERTRENVDQEEPAPPSILKRVLQKLLDITLKLQSSY